MPTYTRLEPQVEIKSSELKIAAAEIFQDGEHVGSVKNVIAIKSRVFQGVRLTGNMGPIPDEWMPGRYMYLIKSGMLINKGNMSLDKCFDIVAGFLVLKDCYIYEARAKRKDQYDFSAAFISVTIDEIKGPGKEDKTI